jgi:hypothetical protein
MKKREKQSKQLIKSSVQDESWQSCLQLLQIKAGRLRNRLNIKRREKQQKEVRNKNEKQKQL